MFSSFCFYQFFLCYLFNFINWIFREIMSWDAMNRRWLDARGEERKGKVRKTVNKGVPIYSQIEFSTEGFSFPWWNSAMKIDFFCSPTAEWNFVLQMNGIQQITPPTCCCYRTVLAGGKLFRALHFGESIFSNCNEHKQWIGYLLVMPLYTIWAYWVRNCVIVSSSSFILDLIYSENNLEINLIKWN